LFGLSTALSLIYVEQPHGISAALYKDQTTRCKNQLQRSTGPNMNQKLSIPWFNPRQMDDETVQSLSTAQDELLALFEQAVETRLKNKVATKHWLITGTRGAGKSFFLRSVQTRNDKWQALNVTYILMPEELRNIFAPAEFLNETRYLLAAPSDDFGAAAAWRTSNDDGAWQTALDELLAATDSDLIIIGVENFDQLLKRAFDGDINASKLRRLLENEPRIMLLASTVDSSFDENYNNRLFCQFEQHPILSWSPKAHRDYLTKRAAVEGQTPDANQLSRIDAYSRFTGGNARVAAVLASLILEQQDPLVACGDLTATLDKMTDYYRAQIDRIPDKPSKLFDALIRGGEPCSQTEMAERVGAKQSDIAKAFSWLVDFGYIVGERLKGEKAVKYQVADRLFCQFYRMRHLRQQNSTKLTILTDLLADTILFKDKWRFADKYLKQGLEPEARTMVELGFNETRISLKKLPETLQGTAQLIELGALVSEDDWPFEAQSALEYMDEHYDNEADFVAYINSIKSLARASTQTFNGMSAEQMIAVIDDNIIPFIMKIGLYKLMLKPAGKALWEAITAMLDAHDQQLQVIKSKIPENYESLKQIMALATNNPMASSYNLFCYFLPEGNFNLCEGNAEVRYDEIRYSIKAFKYWLDGKHYQQAVNCLGFCMQAYEDAIEQGDLDGKLHRLILRFCHQAVLIKELDATGNCSYLLYQIWWQHNRQHLALKLLSQALDKAIGHEKYESAGHYLHQLAWKKAELGLFTDAKVLFTRMLDNKYSSGLKVWEHGQIGRCITNLDGLDKAWAYIDNITVENKFNEQELMQCVQQLADVVLDFERHRNAGEAFVLTKQLLLDIGNREALATESGVRMIWISMVDVGVSFALQRDILAEVVELLGEKLSELVNVLAAWLEDLDKTIEERALYRKQLDPDLRTSFVALEQNLNDEAKARYGIDAGDEEK
jgi:hypothetical protein